MPVTVGSDTSKTRRTLSAGGKSVAYYSIPAAEAAGLGTFSNLPAALKVDGGATANDLLCQIQADLLGIAVDRPRVLETTAAGAAYLAGLATGFWSGLEELAALRKGQVQDYLDRLTETTLTGHQHSLTRSLHFYLDDRPPLSPKIAATPRSPGPAS